MLEKYLEEKGITANAIYKLFPDLEEDVKNYFFIQESSQDEYKDEMEKLSNELVETLKTREDAINEYVANPPVEVEETETPSGETQSESEEVFDIPEIPDYEIPEIPDMPDIDGDIPDIPEIPTTEPIAEVEVEIPDIPEEKESSGELDLQTKKGYIVRNSEITPNIFMKILALNGIDYRGKTYPNAKPKDKFYFWFGNNLYVVTDKNPFDKPDKIDIYVYSQDNSKLADAYSIVQSKVISSTSKGAPKKEFDLNGLEDITNADTEEPVTKIPYKIVDETIQEIWKLKSMEELSELMSLSKKYGCGCGKL